MKNPRLLLALLAISCLANLMMVVIVGRTTKSVEGSTFTPAVIVEGFVPPGVSFVGKPLSGGEQDVTVRLCPGQEPELKRLVSKRGAKFVLKAQ